MILPVRCATAAASKHTYETYIKTSALKELRKQIFKANRKYVISNFLKIFLFAKYYVTIGNSFFL